MTDILTRRQRIYNMSQIKARDTKPELRIRKLLFVSGLKGYRICYNLSGKPDIAFIKKKIVIFIDGCFRHKCPICYVRPVTRQKFWESKINSNVSRDKKINKKLAREGWKVLRFWEHQVKKNPEKIVLKISQALRCKK